MLQICESELCIKIPLGIQVNAQYFQIELMQHGPTSGADCITPLQLSNLLCG